MISCRCVILANYWQFTLVRLSQKAVFADALFFLMRAEFRRYFPQTFPTRKIPPTFPSDKLPSTIPGYFSQPVNQFRNVWVLLSTSTTLNNPSLLMHVITVINSLRQHVINTTSLKAKTVFNQSRERVKVSVAYLLQNAYHTFAT